MIDPHKMAIHEFLQAVDESRIPDCILHDPSDPDFVLALPLFPLFEGDDTVQLDAATANISYSLFSLFPRHELGFHNEKGIANLVRTILTVPDLSLVEARTLLDRGHKGAALREKICFQVKDPILVEYWSHEFGVIDKAIGARIKSRVDRLFESRRLLPLFANKLKRLSYSEIVSSNKIFLACTSVQSGPDLASILGAIHLTALQTAAFSRNPVGGVPSTFTLFVDEFGNYSNPTTMGHFLRTLRKYGISQVLATQDIEALPAGIKEAIGNINTHLIFRQGWTDAQHYAKFLNNRVPVNDFTSTGIGEAFVKMGGQFAKIRTQLAAKKRGLEILEEVRRLTREQYCIPTQEVMAQLRAHRQESAVALDSLKSLDQF